MSSAHFVHFSVFMQLCFMAQSLQPQPQVLPFLRRRSTAHTA